MQSGYRIRAVGSEELGALVEIERAAARRFESLAVSGIDPADATPLENFERAAAEGRLWVAAAPDDSPVGFAVAEQVDGCAHLEEVDVIPAHERRGVGTALVDAVCAWARDGGLPAVTLTTFRDVPWNAPWYERLGFRVLARAELGPGLAARVEDEERRGLRPDERVVMRLDAPEARARSREG